MSEILTSSPTPPAGIMDALLPNASPADRFAFWLRLHAIYLNPRACFAQIVLRECLPSPDTELRFELAR